LRAKAGFYSVLLDGCGNRVVKQTLQQLNNRMVLYKRLSLSVAGRLPGAIAELEAVVAAIDARDIDRAGDLAEAHILNSEKNVLRQLSDQTDEAQEALEKASADVGSALRPKSRRVRRSA
jgi:DNA-binding GntR family transcriptional regulator